MSNDVLGLLKIHYKKINNILYESYNMKETILLYNLDSAAIRNKIKFLYVYKVVFIFEL